MKEIGLSLQTISPSSLPNLRKNVKRNHIGQRLVSENVQSGSTFGVSPAASPEECERRIDFSGHQQPHQQHAEASAAHDPLFQIHLAVRSRIETDKRPHCDDGRNYRQGNEACSHSVPPSLLGGLGARGASSRYAPHMQSGVRTSHEMSQKKLNGKPRTMGYTRSHRDTEKQIATNGISPSKIAPTRGLRTAPPLLSDPALSIIVRCLSPH